MRRSKTTRSGLKASAFLIASLPSAASQTSNWEWLSMKVRMAFLTEVSSSAIRMRLGIAREISTWHCNGIYNSVVLGAYSRKLEAQVQSLPIKSRYFSVGAYWLKPVSRIDRACAGEDRTIPLIQRRSHPGSPSKYARIEFRRYFSVEAFKERMAFIDSCCPHRVLLQPIPNESQRPHAQTIIVRPLSYVWCPCREAL